MECATEPCCRSINYKKTLTLQDESNCEMLHHVIFNTSEKLLEKDDSADYIYLVNPQKVRVHLTMMVRTYNCGQHITSCEESGAGRNDKCICLLFHGCSLLHVLYFRGIIAVFFEYDYDCD